MLDMKNTPSSLLQISSSLLLLVLSGASVKAQTTWNNPTTNAFWNVAGNWSNGVPTSTTDVFFSGTGGDILINASVSNAFKSLKFNANDSDYTLKSSDDTKRNLIGPSSGTSVFQAGFGATNSTLTIENLFIRAYQTSSLGDNGSGNSLIVTGNTQLDTYYTAGFRIGSGTGSIAANSNNTLTVQNGALFASGNITVGGKGEGNKIIVTGSGTILRSNNTSPGLGLTIGNSTSAATNRVEITNGATAELTTTSTAIVGGALMVGKGSSLNHISTTQVQELRIGSKGTLFGAGSIKVGILRYDSALSGAGGGKVYIGETAAGFGELDFTGTWQNSNITLNLEVGDLTGGAVAGTNYDLLDITGAFAFGGNISIDISGAIFGAVDELQIISWTSSTGLPTDLNVSFVNGNSTGYVIREDGLYLQSIPEPGAIALLALGGCGLGLLARNKRKA